jgi:hypothetical protein
MTPKIEKLKSKILALQAGLAPLMAELEEELKGITVDDVLGGAVNAPISTSKPRKSAGERKPRAGGLPAKLLAVLASQQNTGFTADELIGELKIDPEKAAQVRTTLSRLLKTGKIASNHTGVYQHKEAV